MPKNTRRCEMPLPGADPDDPDGRCNNEFEPNHPQRKYCYTCAPSQKERQVRRCEARDCTRTFTAKSERQKYHDEGCRRREKDRRRRERQREARIRDLAARERIDDALGLIENAEAAERGHKRARIAKVRGVTAQRGDDYRDFVEKGFAEDIRTHKFTQTEIAEAMGVTNKTISAWMSAYHEDREIIAQREDWEMPADAADTLLVPGPVSYKQLQAAIAENLDRAVDCIVAFRSRNFLDEDGDPYQTPEFQRRWYRAWLEAIATGGRSVTLASPRHGKSQGLIHLLCWLILHCPNVRVLWIGGNADIADMMGGAVCEELDLNERLGEYLPPGDQFKPKHGTGNSWKGSEFTVGIRTVTGIKSPTFRALGCGGKILSRDADVIVGDDIIDIEDAYSPAEREKKRHWVNTQVSSRKEAHTALLFIGSRQHHLDWWGEAADNPAWSTVVDTAHSFDCDLAPPHPHGAPDDHQPDCPDCAAHHECVLWPGKRTMHFLQDQRAAMANDTHFEMVYLNQTRPEGAVFLTKSDLEGCQNPLRKIGSDQHGQPITAQNSGGLTLIAGLDPAATSDQAAVLWAYDATQDKRYLVDTDVQRGGGLTGAHEVIVRWHERYGLKHWVIERNRYQDSIMQAQQITEYCASNGIRLQPHFTHATNKHDPTFGIPYQMQLFKSQQIDLPWGADPETREKVRVYMRQLLNFDGDDIGKTKRKRKNDLVLAGWFPENEIRHWRAELEVTPQVSMGQTPYPVAQIGDSYSYPGAVGSGLRVVREGSDEEIPVVSTGRVA